jgi:hypothetical protein
MLDAKRLRLIVACGILLLAAIVVVPISAVHNLNVFELEGDAIDDSAVAGDDWSSVNFAGGAPLARTGVLADPGNRTIFTGGGSKDTIDISSWNWKDESGGLPDKDNITNAYAAAYTVNGQLVLYFGADRFANDGDAQLGFWFFQQNIKTNLSGSFDGTHTVGDLLVLANFSNGGAQVTIEVLRWVGTGGDQRGGTLDSLLVTNAAQCGPALDQDMVCAVSNPGPTASPWPYTPKQGTAGTFPTFSFFEGGINISQVFGGGTPPCFASFMAETRSSTSVTAVLKDFVLGEFPVCGIAINKDCTTGVIAPDESGFIYTFEGTVRNTGFGALYDVKVVDDAGTPLDTTDDQTIEIGTIAAQGTASYSGSFSSTQNPPTNRVTVTAATTPGGATALTAEAQDTCPEVTISPFIDVTKNCQAKLEIQSNRIVVRVDFAGLVCATGNVGLSNVTVTDDHAGQVFSAASLAKGACAPYSGSYYPNVIGSDNPSLAEFTDTVTARGRATLGGQAVTDIATATCPLCPPAPH